MGAWALLMTPLGHPFLGGQQFGDVDEKLYVLILTSIISLMESPSGNNATFGKVSLDRKIFTEVNFVLMRSETQPRHPQ